MSATHDTVSAGTEETVEQTAHEHHGDHPTPAQYVQIALVLAVLTALEVFTYVIDFGIAFLPTLMFLMVTKFALVVAWFMHLRFDSRVFRRFLVIGIVLALAVYSAVLAMFAEPEGANSFGDTAALALAVAH